LIDYYSTYLYWVFFFFFFFKERKEKRTMSGLKVAVALGGNALQASDKPATAEGQLEVVKETAAHLAELKAAGVKLVVAHGNGPQVGRILLASEAASSVTPAMPFDVCGAMSQVS